MCHLLNCLCPEKQDVNGDQRCNLNKIKSETPAINCKIVEINYQNISITIVNPDLLFLL